MIIYNTDIVGIARMISHSDKMSQAAHVAKAIREAREMEQQHARNALRDMLATTK